MSTNTPRAIELADKQAKWNSSDCMDAAAELRRLAEVEAELERIKALSPTCWAMRHPHGYIIDVITPAEHEREEGFYTIPLFDLTQPKEPTT